jgi:hypothetical protein
LYVKPKMQLVDPGSESATVQFIAVFDDPTNSEGCPEFTLYISCAGCGDRQKVASIQSDCEPDAQGHASWGPRFIRLGAGEPELIVEAKTARKTYLVREGVSIKGTNER